MLLATVPAASCSALRHNMASMLVSLRGRPRAAATKCNLYMGRPHESPSASRGTHGAAYGTFT